MTLKRYIAKKFGNRKSLSGSLNYMLKASFFSTTFRDFWKHWNPLWSYFLTYYLYKPLKTVIPKPIAILLTFAVSGALHDLALMILLQWFNYLFTLIFLAFGFVVLIESFFKINLNSMPKIIRPIYHTGIIVLCTIIIKNVIDKY